MLFWLLNAAQEGGPAAETAGRTEAHAGGGAEHHTPVVVEAVNHFIKEYLGNFVYRLQTYPNYGTRALWDRFFSYFGKTAEDVFGPYTPENAVPWWTVMFIIACILSVTLIWILKGKLSEDEPGHGQQTLEATVLAVRNLLIDVVGVQGVRYFPVVATFGILILVSNLMGFFPLFVSPTAATSVTFALGLTSFIYYNYIGIKENGLFGHLRHFAGPVLAIAPLLFIIELISNLIRPFTLGIRLFGNIFADEQVMENISGLYPSVTHWVIPVLLMPLGLFVAFIQTFIFIFLSMVYLSEVSHAPHDEHAEQGWTHDEGEEIIAPVLT